MKYCARENTRILFPNARYANMYSSLALIFICCRYKYISSFVFILSILCWTLWQKWTLKAPQRKAIYKAIVHISVYEYTKRVSVVMTLFTRIREVLGSNLSRDIGCPFEFFHDPPSPYRDSTSIRPRPLPSKFFPMHRTSIMPQFDAL
jgi:hypothetical protein